LPLCAQWLIFRSPHLAINSDPQLGQIPLAPFTASVLLPSTNAYLISYNLVVDVSTAKL
jgi:hypothetical protein